MEIFNIGPLELFIFLIIAFVLLGPKDMVLTAYKIGESIRKLVRSPMWREILRSAQEIRELPTKLMDETGLKEELAAIQKDTTDVVKEVNSSMNEAIDAARVPEAEHIKLETGPSISPAVGAVAASTGPTYPPPIISTPPNNSINMPVMPAVFDGPPVPGMAKKFSPATPTSITNLPGDNAPATVSEENGTAPESGNQQAVVAVDQEPVEALVKKRATRKKKVVEPIATEPVAIEQPVVDELSAVIEVDQTAIELPAVDVPMRKRAVRKKKFATVDQVTEDLLRQTGDLLAAVGQPPIEEQPAVLSTVIDTPEIEGLPGTVETVQPELQVSQQADSTVHDKDDNGVEMVGAVLVVDEGAPAVAVRKRVVRKKKVVSTSDIETTGSTAVDEVAPAKVRRQRARKNGTVSEEPTTD